MFLIERNRAPFDFAEGESELVSGFNTEYSSLPFTLLFLREYGAIMFFCCITVVFFLPIDKPLSFICYPFFIVLVAYYVLWVRGTYPRYRYDLLMCYV
jgi:NADH-ubiquinone oxidoreductase chain 1